MSEIHDRAKQDALDEVNRVAKDFGEGPLQDVAPLTLQREWGSYEPSQDERTLAMLAHLCCFFLSILGPALIFALKGNDSPFIRYHAMQALLFQIAGLVIILPVVFLTCGMGFPIAFLPWVGGVMYALKANDGEWDGYPGLSEMGK